jgi:hypothetical protein
MDGWWLAQEYVTKPSELVVEGDPCGHVDDRVIEALYAILEGYYWADR